MPVKKAIGFSERSNRRIGNEEKSSSNFLSQSNRRHSVLLKRLDIAEAALEVSPIATRQSRRQSLAINSKGIINLSHGNVNRTTKVPQRKSTSHKVLPTSYKRPRENNQSAKIISDSNLKLPPTQFYHSSKKPRRESMNKLTTIKSFEQSDKIAPTSQLSKAQKPKLQSTVSHTVSSPIKKIAFKKRNQSKLPQKEKNAIKKTTTSTESTNISTPLASPYQEMRITRSAKKISKKVVISSNIPTSLEGTSASPLTKASKKEKKESAKAKPFGKKTFDLKPFTPKPEDPSNILKRNLKKRIAVELTSVVINPSKDDLEKNSFSHSNGKSPPIDIPYQQNGLKSVLPSTPSSDSHLPPTPKSSRKRGSRIFQRFDNSMTETPFTKDFSHDQFRNGTPRTDSDDSAEDISLEDILELDESNHLSEAESQALETSEISPSSKKGLCSLM